MGLMAYEITDYGNFKEIYSEGGYRSIYIDNDDLDVEEVRLWLLDESRLGDFYLTRTSAYQTGISDIVCLMTDEDTAFEFKMRWK